MNTNSSRPHTGKPPPGKPPIGLSDFPRLIREGYSYVDKSLFVQSVLDSSAQVILLPRPRRFGKTLNLSMLRAFFERDMQGSAELFQGLAIKQAGEEYTIHQGRYPVFLTLKDVKTLNWEDCLGHVKDLICERGGKRISANPPASRAISLPGRYPRPALALCRPDGGCGSVVARSAPSRVPRRDHGSWRAVYHR
uniref:Predicted AAA-ATPase n=1 Tax=Candidatus Kentrum sp. UNK TaxID=2126344 RepID=A0A451B1R0_9GAMM|nr:MAG: Predicted AAA-ATPase [Candidatus Kentron sp. UNK]VFK72226.1 MAG: Predicted AAA-ATPase [Candidatus Kentron sp. UNK]